MQYKAHIKQERFTTFAAFAAALAAGFLDADRAAEDFLASHILDCVVTIARVLESDEGKAYW
jgi:hypothetical protein